MQLTPADAQMAWIGQRIRSDQFQVYCFASPNVTDDGVAAAIRQVGERVDRIGELQAHAVPVPGELDYPYWSRRGQGPDLVEVHRLVDRSFAGFHYALGELVATSLDITVSPWRIHLFPDIVGAPGCDGRALFAIFQVSHAFADGRRASALARQLFSRALPPMSAPPSRAPFAPAMLARAAAKLPGQIAGTVRLARSSVVAQKELADAEAAGAIAPRAPGCPLTQVNVDPGPHRSARMLVREGMRFTHADVTVTIAAATAISTALARYLGDNAHTDALAAEVTVAVPDAPGTSRNAYRNVSVRLYPQITDVRERASRIALDLAERRRRIADPRVGGAGGGVEHVPARLLRRGVRGFDLTAVPTTVAGNTVISSVFRGAADLRLAGRDVRFTAGFPALSPVMGLTHGVHGIGGVVTVGVLTSAQVIPDVDDYVDILAAALDEVTAALQN